MDLISKGALVRPEGSPLRVRGLHTLGGIAVLGFVVYVCSLVVVSRSDSSALWIDSWGTLVVEGIAVLVLVARPWSVTQERRSWGWIASAMALYFCADLLWNFIGQPENSSAADVLYLCFYPLMYVGLISLVRQRTHARELAPWLDGITCGLAVAGVAAAFLVGPTIEAASKLDTLGAVVNLAYPIADLLLIVIVVSLLGPIRWKPDAALTIAFAGLFCMALADVAFLKLTSTGEFHVGSFIDAGWMASCVLLMVASWTRLPHVRRDLVVDRTKVSVTPLIASAVAIAVMVAGRSGSVPFVAVLASAGALATAIARMVLAHQDIRALGTSHQQARTDELTTLLNRRGFAEVLSELTTAGTSVAVILLDLDGFKEVNDSLGHHAGDQLLSVVAARLQHTVGLSGKVARLGGDEFALVLPNASITRAWALSERIHAALTEPSRIDGLEIRIDASIGIAVSPEHGADANGLLRCSDVAMYQAKRSGKPTMVYQPEADPHSRDQVVALAEVHRAFEQDELVLHYQPKVSLIDRRVHGFEALVRWNHPKRGLLLPDDFLPLIERANLMPRLTRVVLHKALADASGWPTNGDGAWSVSVNIAPGDLLDESFPAGVISALQAVDFVPNRLILEITEGTLLSEPHRAQRAITRLRETGVRVSLDDFGIGFSSLSHLANLTIDELKLDRSLVADVANEQRSRAIVTATAGLAEALGVDLVVEGIEDESTIDLLTGLRCDLAQGFLFGRPMPSDEISSWFRSINRPIVAVAGE